MPMNQMYLLTLGLLMLGCDVFDKEETIPGFVIITESDLSTTTAQGAPTSKIVDATVFADNEFVGTFELPAKVPILKNGATRIRVAPGIFNNGLSSDRRIYPFYEFFSADVDLIPDAVIPLTPDSSLTYTYFDSGLAFEREDFDGSGNTLVFSDSSSTMRTAVSSPTVFSAANKAYEILLDTEQPSFQAFSTWGLSDLPKGNNIYLEIDFKGTVPLELGILTLDPDLRTIFALGLIPQTDFTKIYVDLTNEIAQQISTNNYEIYLRATLPAGATNGSIYIDNLKFVYPQ